MSPDTSDSKLWDDVKRLLADLEFSVPSGAYVEGDLASAEVVARRRRDGDGFDLDVTIKPFALSTELHPDAEAGARKAFREALNSHRPAIRAAAAAELARLDAPRAKQLQLEGWLVLLRRKIDDSWVTLLPPATTDRSGRARVSRVPSCSICSLDIRARGVSSCTLEKAVAAPRKAAAAAREASEDGLTRLGDLRLATYTLADRRLTAVFEELPRGEAALTIHTRAMSLDGSRIFFQIGEEKGEVRLMAESSGEVIGSVNLSQPYREVDAEIPSFTIITSPSG
jgi:hypothetical protein